MRYQITGAGWPVGSALIPAGVVIDTNARPDLATLTPPINATALDDEAWQAQLAAYPRHLLGSPPPMTKIIEEFDLELKRRG